MLRSLLGCLCLLSFGLSAYATPLLRCQVSYAGSAQVVEARLSRDPYAAPLVDIGERFKFKAVMVGQGTEPEYIKLYAYFQTRAGDVPIHQATYLPPFQIESAERNFTPFNQVYAGPLERELQYQCSLQRMKP